MASENKKLSVIKVGNEFYDIKDSLARETCENISELLKSVPKLSKCSLAQYTALETKDNSTLYILDNNLIYNGSLLLNNLHIVSSSSVSSEIDDYGFPTSLTDDMMYNYYISMVNGEIRYVSEDLSYVNITELEINNLLLNQSFLSQLITSIADTKTIKMPTLTVEGSKVIWTGSDVDNITVFIPKTNN